MCVCVFEKERERVCVCVCLRMREREREREREMMQPPLTTHQPPAGSSPGVPVETAPWPAATAAPGQTPPLSPAAPATVAGGDAAASPATVGGMHFRSRQMTRVGCRHGHQRGGVCGVLWAESDLWRDLFECVWIRENLVHSCCCLDIVTACRCYQS